MARSPGRSIANACGSPRLDLENGSLLQSAAMPATGSTLLLDELFQSGDPRVLEELRACRSSAKLGSLAEPWLKDGRGSMRAALLRYADECCELPRHQPLVKGLFKRAEAAGDDELLAHFLHAFDGWSRRVLVNRRR